MRSEAKDRNSLRGLAQANKQNAQTIRLQNDRASARHEATRTIPTTPPKVAQMGFVAHYHRNPYPALFQRMNLEIKQIDEKLSILRESYLDAKPERKQHWMDKINELLDQRLALMKP